MIIQIIKHLLYEDAYYIDLTDDQLLTIGKADAEALAQKIAAAINDHAVNAVEISCDWLF